MSDKVENEIKPVEDPEEIDYTNATMAASFESEQTELEWIEDELMDELWTLDVLVEESIIAVMPEHIQPDEPRFN